LNDTNKIFKLLKGRITLSHLVLILILSLLAVILGFYASKDGTIAKETVALSLATALATATIVDLLYNFVVMKDIEEMVATHLMLNKDVQKEILKKEKVDDILSCSLESTVGKDLRRVIENAIINRVRIYKDVVRKNVVINVVLQNFDKYPDELKLNFYKLEMITKYQEILTSQHLTFVATDDDDEYTKESNKINEEERTYVFFLPDKIKEIPNK